MYLLTADWEDSKDETEFRDLDAAVRCGFARWCFGASVTVTDLDAGTSAPLEDYLDDFQRSKRKYDKPRHSNYLIMLDEKREWFENLTMFR